MRVTYLSQAHKLPIGEPSAEYIRLESKILHTTLATDSPTFFASSNLTRPKTDTHRVGLVSNDIAEVFNFDPQLIISIKEGLCKSIEINTKDFETATMIGENIRTKLENDNKRHYGGLIRPGGVLRNKPLVEISFDALIDLQNAIATHQTRSKLLPV